MARRQGLKPAKRPAAKTVAADDMVRSWRAFSEAHVGEVTTVICELSLAKAGDNAMTNATVSRIAVMQYRTESILTFLDGCVIVIKDNLKGGWTLDYLQILMQIKFQKCSSELQGFACSPACFLTNDMIAVMSDSGLLPSAAWGRPQARGGGGPHGGSRCVRAESTVAARGPGRPLALAPRGAVGMQLSPR